MAGNVGRQIDDGAKKAFDFAADLTKQLITLATAIMTLIVTFSQNFLTPSGLTSSGALQSVVVPFGVKKWLIGALFAFVASIFAGLFTYGQLTRVLQEDQNPTVNDPSTLGTAVTQWLLFLIGLILTIVYVWKVALVTSGNVGKPS